MSSSRVAASEEDEESCIYTAVAVAPRADEGSAVKEGDDEGPLLYSELDFAEGDRDTQPRHMRVDMSVNPKAPPWYHGDVHPSVAAEFLAGCADDTFLVRAGGVDFRFELVVVRKGSSVSTVISRQQRMYSMRNCGRASELASKSLAGLVDILRKPSPAWPKPLRHFLPRPTAPEESVAHEIARADSIRGRPLEDPPPPPPARRTAKAPHDKGTAAKDSADTPFMALLKTLWLSMQPAADDTVDGSQVREVVMRSGLDSATLGVLWAKLDPPTASLDYTLFGQLLGLIAQTQCGDPLDIEAVNPTMAPPNFESGQDDLKMDPGIASGAAPVETPTRRKYENNQPEGLYETTSVRATSDSTTRLKDCDTVPAQVQQDNAAKLQEVPLVASAKPIRHVYETNAPSAILAAAATEKGSQDFGRYETGEGIHKVAPWYAGAVGRTEADAAVAAAEQGDFLVRESSTSGNMVLAVHDSGEVVSFTVERRAADGKIQLGTVVVDTIDDLIGGLGRVPLTSPLSRLPLRLGQPVVVASRDNGRRSSVDLDFSSTYVDLRLGGPKRKTSKSKDSRRNSRDGDALTRRNSKDGDSAARRSSRDGGSPSKSSGFSFWKKRSSKSKLDKQITPDERQESRTNEGVSVPQNAVDKADHVDLEAIQSYVSAKERPRTDASGNKKKDSHPHRSQSSSEVDEVPSKLPVAAPARSVSAGAMILSAKESAKRTAGFQDVRRKVESCRHLWYLPDIGKQESEEFLQHAGAGAFLCRNSSRFKTCYALSVKLHGGMIWNVLIREHTTAGRAQSGFMISGARVLYTSLDILLARLIMDEDLRNDIKLPIQPLLPQQVSKAIPRVTVPSTDSTAAKEDEWAALKDLILDDTGDTEA